MSDDPMRAGTLGSNRNERRDETTYRMAGRGDDGGRQSDSRRHIPHETVRLASGTSGTTLAGQVKGYDRVQHAMGVTMGQKLDVQLDSGNSSLYFTLTAPVPALRCTSCFQSRARLSPTRPRAGRTRPRPDAADRRAVPWRPRSSASGK